MEDYHWTELGKQFVGRFPAESLQLADKMLEHFGERGTIMERFNSTALRVLSEITRRSPTAVWRRAIKYLDPPSDARAYHITSWLQGSRFFRDENTTGPLALIPSDEIWRWVDEDIGRRAWYVAYFVPKELFRKESRLCLAREILIRYGARKDVRNNLSANFGTEGWSGPESLHYHGRKQWLLDFRKGETNANVKLWIDEYVAALDRQIERAKIQEEREQ